MTDLQPGNARATGAIAVLLAATFGGLAVCPASTRAGEHRLITIDACSLTGRCVAIESNVVRFTVGEEQRLIPLEDVFRIDLTAPKPAVATNRPGRKVLRTRKGDVLGLLRLTGAEGVFSLESDLTGSARIRFADANALLLPGREQTPKEVLVKGHLTSASLTEDALLVDGGQGKLMRVSGVFVGIRGGKVTFRHGHKDRTVARGKVRALRLAGPETDTDAAGSVLGRVGDLAAFTGIAFNGSRFALDSPLMGKLTVPLVKVSSIRVRSPRVTGLSGLAPAEVRVTPLLGMAYPLRSGRSVGGGPLVLDGKTYTNGLSMHSRCELTYDLGGKYERLVARVGIDDAVRPRGNATIQVLDEANEPLIEPVTLTGRSTSRLLRVDLTGRLRMKIVVDYGSDALDVADHVDIVDARLIRPSRPSLQPDAP